MAKTKTKTTKPGGTNDFTSSLISALNSVAYNLAMEDSPTHVD
jgi:hypothetical protein